MAGAGDAEANSLDFFSRASRNTLVTLDLKGQAALFPLISAAFGCKSTSQQRERRLGWFNPLVNACRGPQGVGPAKLLHMTNLNWTCPPQMFSVEMSSDGALSSVQLSSGRCCPHPLLLSEPLTLTCAEHNGKQMFRLGPWGSRRAGSHQTLWHGKAQWCPPLHLVTHLMSQSARGQGQHVSRTFRSFRNKSGQTVSLFL